MSPQIPPTTPSKQPQHGSGMGKESLPTIDDFELPMSSAHSTQQPTQAFENLRHTAMADSVFAKVFAGRDNPFVRAALALGTNDPQAILQVPKALNEVLKPYTTG